MTIVSTSKQAHPRTLDEQILVVKRSYLFPDGTWNGLEEVDMQEYLHIIRSHQEFQPRAAMEDDPRYKQIIPYLVFSHNNTFF
jgi:predicted NUDIX family phosphoesterase